MTVDESTAQPRGRSVFWIVFVTLAVVALLDRSLGAAAAQGHLGSSAVADLVVDLAVWVPLVIGTFFGVRAMQRSDVRTQVDGSDSVLRTLGLRWNITDLFWGFAIACICRAAGAFLSIGFFGTTGFGGSASLDGGPSFLTLAVLVVGTCIITPVVEELFFRGFVLRWWLRHSVAAGEGRLGQAGIVVLSSILFGVMHVLVSQASALVGLEDFLTTFVLGLFVGGVTAVTGRLGTAITAHVFFNAIGIALTWPV